MMCLLLTTSITSLNLPPDHLWHMSYIQFLETVSLPLIFGPLNLLFLPSTSLPTHIHKPSSLLGYYLSFASGPSYHFL